MRPSGSEVPGLPGDAGGIAFMSIRAIFVREEVALLCGDRLSCVPVPADADLLSVVPSRCTGTDTPDTNPRIFWVPVTAVAGTARCGWRATRSRGFHPVDMER